MSCIMNRNKKENLYKTIYTIIMLIIKSGYWEEIHPEFDKQLDYSTNMYDIYMYFNRIDAESKITLKTVMKISVDRPDIYAYEHMLSVISDWDSFYEKTSYILNSNIILETMSTIIRVSKKRGYKKKREKEFIQKYVIHNLILFDAYNAELNMS